MAEHSSSTGRYDVSEELGRGSMGIVCLAHDPVMGRDLAIKTILLPHGLPEQDKYEFRQRFRREAQAAGRLSHPGIVTVYDYSEQEDELPFIAMEYVQGFTLHELIAKEGSLNAEWALQITEVLADALDAAHSAGVVHRDLKPANILVREADGAAKITDFGIARINTTDVTQAGTTYGSPAYMAPERIQGHTADARSDFFSLAVILYEALSGARPFDGEDFASICYSIVNDPPIPIRTRQPELSLAFDAFFRRALAKNPAERFQDGASFCQGLESVLHQQRMFENGSETLKMMTPLSPPKVETALQYGEMIATPVAAVPATSPVVPWRWVAVGAGAVLLLLVSFVAGWMLSGGTQDGQLGVPLDVNTHPAPAKLVEPQEAPARSISSPAAPPAVSMEKETSETSPRVDVPRPEPSPPRPQPAVAAAPEPEPGPAEPPVAQVAEPLQPVETAEAELLEEPGAVPAEPAATQELESAEAATEEAVEPVPPATMPEPVPVTVRIRSGIRDGKLTFLVDGEEVHSIPLAVEPETKSSSIKKVLGKGLMELETQIEILPGRHTITALAYNAIKDREHEASIDLELEVGDMRTLQIVAGRTLGKRLTMKLD